MNDYTDWMRHNVPIYPRGLCEVMTARMTKEFPELRRAKGHDEGVRR